MNKDVHKTVLELIFDYSPVVATANETLLADEMKLAEMMEDSLSLLELIYELEEKYDVTLNSDSLVRLSTVADLVQAIDHELSAAA